MFTVNNLLTENLNTKNAIDVSITEETFFFSTLEYLSEMKNQVREESKILYKSILEGGQEYNIVNESFGDFFGKIKDIIDRFLQYIKNLVNRFIINLNKMVSSDKFINKHKDQLSTFDKIHEFDFEGYEFTIEPQIPVIDALASFNEKFVGLKFEELSNSENIKNAVDKAHGSLKQDLNYEWYDRFRGEVIGKDGITIPQSDFANELFAIYRNGKSSKDTITATADYVMTCLGRFQNYKDIEKQTKNTKGKIELDYEQIKKQIQSMIYRNRDLDAGKLLGITVDDKYDSPTKNITVNNETMTRIDLFIKTKANQVIEMSTIHSLAFSAKLDAITQCYKQDKILLYKSLQRVNSNKLNKQN